VWGRPPVSFWDLDASCITGGTFNFYIVRMWCLDDAARMLPRISRVYAHIVPFFWWT
jgi:hypothetical protein